MQDIAALGFAIDSSKALEAAQNLDRMATASARAESADGASPRALDYPRRTSWKRLRETTFSVSEPPGPKALKVPRCRISAPGQVAAR